MRCQTVLATMAAITLGAAFFGCMESGTVAPGPVPNQEITGSARIVLPPIDVSALPKVGATSQAPAWFVLSISNTGEDSTYSFPLSSSDTNILVIPSIPIGWHYFHGEILDSARKRTHVGDAYGVIAGNTVNSISMKLFYASGSVSICVAIEGQPTPPCYIDSLPDSTFIDTTHPDTMPLPPASRFPNPIVFDSSRVTTCWQFFPNVIDSGTRSHDPCYPDSGYVQIVTTQGRISGQARAFTGQSFQITGSYDTASMRLDAIQKAKGKLPADTLRFNGRWSPNNFETVFGQTTQYPAGRRGNGFLYQVECTDPVNLPSPPATCRER